MNNEDIDPIPATSSEKPSQEENRTSDTNRDIPPSNFTVIEKEAPKFIRKNSQSIKDFFGDQLDAVKTVDDKNEKPVNAYPPSDEEKSTKTSTDFQYNMSHEKRGLFVIFNHETFDSGAAKRDGTNQDRDNLITVAKQLGFEVKRHEDLTHEDIISTINTYAERDHSEHDCFACVILTHGGDGDVLLASDKKYNLQDVLHPIRDCKTLIGKPKMFFIQACRGEKLDDGAKFDQMDCVAANSKEHSKHLIPIEADFCIGYSTVQGYFAWRHGEKGSWFIQALCYCLENFCEELELMQIMTRVNRMVAHDYQSNVSEENHPLNKKKQMPCVMTRLTGDVYFSSAKSTVATETTDGEIVQEGNDVEINLQKAPEPKQKSHSKVLIEAGLELVAISKKKLELKMKEQEILEKIYRHELNMSS